MAIPAHPRIQVKRIRFCPAGWRQKLHYLGFLCWVVGTVAWLRPKWVYASDLYSYPVAWLASFRPGVRVVMHEHDTPHQDAGGVSRLFAWTRKRLARRADVCVVPQSKRAETLKAELHPRQLKVVWNCPPRTAASGTKSGVNHTGLSLWYHGSLVPSQFPVTVVQALAQLPANVELRFAGYETIGHRGYVQELERIAAELGVAERVRFVGTLASRQELLAKAAQCDIGLSLFSREFREPMAGASNKPFDYLACGLALLVTDTSEWIEMFVSAGCGVACNPESPADIAAVVRRLLEKPEQVRAMGEVGRQRILGDWNYETQFETVRQLLEQDR